MKRRLWVSALVLGGVAALMGTGVAGWYLHRFLGPEPETVLAPAGNPAEAKVLAVLDEMQKTGGKKFGIPASDGRRLRLLTEAVGAAKVVEIGTSIGYSGLWLCLGVLPTGGRVTTFEMDPARAEAARTHFRRAGVDQQIDVVVGDAHIQLGTVKGPVDVVFIDADKEGYVDYLERLLPLVRPGGLILAHNVEYAEDYMRRVTSDPSLETTRLTQASGLSVTLKKRQAGRPPSRWAVPPI